MSSNPLTAPYRRFTDEMFAGSLIALLEEHQVSYELVKEPEGAGTLILGDFNAPGVVVMVRPEDVKSIFELEKNARPGSVKEDERQDDEEPMSVGWLAFWYAFALLGAPVSLLAGMHILTSKSRRRDYTPRYTYDASTRRHGRYIFFFALFMLIFGIIRMTTSPHGSVLAMFSYLLSMLRIR